MVRKLTRKESETKNLLINKIIERKKQFFQANTHDAVFCGGGRCGRDCVGRCGV